MGDRIRPPRGKHEGKRIAEPAPVPGVPPQQQTPLFCLEFLQGDYCLSLCDKDQKAAFADRLHLLARLRWAEIENAPRKGLGYERINKASLKAPIPAGAKSLVTDDVNLIAFRFFGNAPMVGFRLGRVFHVLFLDRNFTLYDHG